MKMIDINWKEFMGFKPENLSQREKDDLCETVVSYNPEGNLSKKYLIHFILIIQQILKYKSELVESLTFELDEMATKQGTEESSKLQQYRDEIEHIQEELDWYRKQDKDSSYEKFREKLTQLQIQNEELLGELNEKEKELMLEKKEVERYASLLATMEREKQELTRELKALQEDNTEKSIRALKNSPESDDEKHLALTGIIKQKNKHISQLLLDVETIEKENLTLRQKISLIKEELTETTTNMLEITVELSKLKHLNNEYEKNEIDFKEKINSLMCQIEELVDEKEKHNAQLDEYVSILNVRSQEWKEALSLKDNELIQMKEEMRNLQSLKNAYSFSDLADVDLIKKISQQNDQIQILQQELEKATQEILTSTELIEKLKEKQMNLISLPGIDKCAIGFLEEKIEILEEKLKFAENDAQAKAEESSILIAQLRDYESNVFGLSEAVAKIHKLENLIREKDLQCEKLVDVCNHFELKLNDLEEQNLAMREKLDLPLTQEVGTSGVARRVMENEKLVKKLKLELEQKEEELIEAKLTCRKLASRTKKSILERKDSNVKKDNRESENEISVKINAILMENDALRKGMHEILESIRHQNTLGDVQVQSTCLERLLEALDSRHVSGWYHPAMRLQAQLSSEEGRNDELRNQIRYLKAEERKKASELQNAYLKIQSLENDYLSSSRTEEIRERGDDREAIIENEEPENQENWRKTPTNFAQEKKIIDEETKFYELKVLFHKNEAEFRQKEARFAQKKEEFLTKIEQLQIEVNVLKNQNPRLKGAAELTGQMVALNRQMNYLKNLEATQREVLEKVKSEFIEEQEKTLLDILKLQKEKVDLINKLEELEETVTNSVPLEKFTCIQNELALVTAKYKNVIDFSLFDRGEESGENYKMEIESLMNEKSQLTEELRKTKEQLVISEALIKEETVTKGDFSNEVTVLASKLAESEVKELNERQKSVHLEKVNEALKLHQRELENRNKELMDKIVKLSEENFKYQEMERKFREKEWYKITTEDHAVLKEKIECLERKIQELTTERENIQELFEISQGQCRTFQQWKNADRIVLAAQKEEILLLQSAGDDKAHISRLSHELATSKLVSLELSKKNEDLKLNITKLLTQNLHLEGKISQVRGELFKTKKKHLNQVGYLFQTMRDIRNACGFFFSFRDLEDIYKSKMELDKKRKETIKEMDKLKAQSLEYSLRDKEMKTQLEALEDLKRAFKGDARNLISWHNKNTALRLKEAKHRRHNEILLSEVNQLRSHVERLNNEIATLEEESIRREKEWDKKQLLWEENQLYVCQLMRENGFRKSSLEHQKTFREAATNTLILDWGQSKEEKLADSEEVKKGEQENGKNESDAMDGCFSPPQPEKTTGECEIADSEKTALKMTIESLENVVKQKEGTILRYRNLLKEEREEYGKAYAKLQDELKDLNEKLTVQSRAFNKLKNAAKENNTSADNVSNVVEKYLTTIQELEEELRECQMTLSSMNTEAHLNREEAEKWRTLAAERLFQLENAKERIDAEYKLEMENYKKDIRNLKVEVERLKRALEGRPNGFNVYGSDRREKSKLQEKTETCEVTLKMEKPEEKFRNSKEEQCFREIEVLKRQLQLAKNEANRLREQIRLSECRSQKRPKTESSDRSSAAEGSLTSKIKNLEELLSTSKEREKELMELTQKKLKSAEEVARWDERKKNEQTVKNLMAKLKEKEAEVETLKQKNESFRNLIYKCERDKGVLETQLKALKGSSVEHRSKIEKLASEKENLEKALKGLEAKLEEEKRQTSGIGAALLREKLEVQERKLVAYELAARGQSSAAEDINRLQTLNSNLEKLNLKLESENLSLRLKLEREKIEGKCLKKKRVDRTSNGMEKIKRDGRFEKRERTLDSRPRTADCCAFKKGKECGDCDDSASILQIEMDTLREKHRLLQESYADAMKENAALKDEVSSYRYQIHLMEQKDFAHMLTKENNTEETLALCREVENLKIELAHKNQLLSRVKVLLVKAAAKEKALLEQADELTECLSPPRSAE